MFSPNINSIYKAPLQEDDVRACRNTNCGLKQSGIYLGRTLPSLLDEGCAFKNKSPATINSYTARGQWQNLTLPELKRVAEEIAIGLQQQLTEPKAAEAAIYPRAALLMSSDTAFVMADIGCLLAQFVTVPMLPEQTAEATEHILKETAARVLFVSKIEQIAPLLPKISKLSNLRLIVVADLFSSVSKAELDALRGSLPETTEIVSMSALRQRAKWTLARSQALHRALTPKDLATIVYTLTDTGQLLGAMLTHENLSGSVLAAFSTLPCLRKGPNEVALSFLPLHHIFARGFVYGALCYGQSIYFSTPRLVMKHLRELKPTVFYTVPRLLEKVYEGWQKVPAKLKGPFSQPKQMAWQWAWDLAQNYRLDEPQTFQYRLQLWLARQTILRPLKNLFGGRLACFITGGAALSAEVMTTLSAAGLGICQGYGLTEASSTVCFTRRRWNRSGTVGVPMPGVELALSSDREVMVRSPYVMQGYYKHPEKTRAVLESNGWLHTGDRGEFSADGLLTLTGYKKELFKLSIGEYIAPVPIEQALQRSRLVKEALVVGPGRKFCGALIIPNIEALATQLELIPLEPLMGQSRVVEAYQALVDQVNQTLPFWAKVKRFHLVAHSIVDEQLFTAKQPIREGLYFAFKEEIAQLYETSSKSSMAQAVPSRAQTSLLPQTNTLSSKTRRLHHV